MLDAIMGWFNPTRWLILLVVVLAVGAAVLGYGELRYAAGVKATTQTYELALGKQKVEAATRLSTEIGKVLTLERSLGELKSKLESDYEKRRMDSKVAEDALRGAAARNGGRLRDPNAGCGRGGGGAESKAAASAGDGAKPDAEAGGLLSVQLTHLLGRVLRESDELNDAYAFCRDWSIGVEQKINEVGPEEK